MKISDNFYRSEFACKDNCGFATVDILQVQLLERIHFHFHSMFVGYDFGIEITSGCRCINHNEEVQKKANKNYIPFSSRSRHTLGDATDFKVWSSWKKNQVNPGLVADYIDSIYPDTLGLGRYKTFTHVDQGPFRRWGK